MTASWTGFAKPLRVFDDWVPLSCYELNWQESFLKLVSPLKVREVRIYFLLLFDAMPFFRQLGCLLLSAHGSRGRS
jgi:hypothetical protein